MAAIKLIKNVINFFRKLKPRYYLSLDSQFYNPSTEKFVYRFKMFGEHTFLKFTFDDIRTDKSILYDINPEDLMRIAIENYIASHKKAMLSVSEILRDNKYKLLDSMGENILSGDEICNNIFLIEKIRNIDLYKIAYNTGFDHGKSLIREIRNKSNISDDNPENVVTFHVIERQNNVKEM